MFHAWKNPIFYFYCYLLFCTKYWMNIKYNINILIFVNEYNFAFQHNLLCSQIIWSLINSPNHYLEINLLNFVKSCLHNANLMCLAVSPGPTVYTICVLGWAISLGTNKAITCTSLAVWWWLFYIFSWHLFFNISVELFIFAFDPGTGNNIESINYFHASFFLI